MGASSPIVADGGSIGKTVLAYDSKGATFSDVGGSAFGLSRLSCRPWEREDLLRRLTTFKPSNLSRKPKIASSLACAQKGWMNTDIDSIACETCGACLSMVLLPSSVSSEG